LVALQAERDIKNAVSFIRRCANATMALVYAVRGTSLEPRAAVSSSGSGETLFKKASDIGADHTAAIGSQELVQLPKEISPDDTSTERELLVNLAASEGRTYLIRLIYQGSDCRGLNSRCKTRVAQAMDYVTTVLAGDGTNGGSSETVDLPFTVGLLDALHIGACLIDERGSIAGFNQTLAEMLGGVQPEGSFTDLAGILGSCNSADLADEIITYFSSSTPDTISDYETGLYLPTGEQARLSIIRFSSSPTDLQACIAVVPCQPVKAEMSIAVTASEAVVHAIAPVS
jgi:hypothetical protein